MNKGEPVNIRKVGNGFIVTPIQHPATAVSDHETMVFNEIICMNDWLEGHFKDHEIKNE